MSADHTKPGQPEKAPTQHELLTNRLHAAAARATGLAELMYGGDFLSLDERQQQELLGLNADLSGEAFSAAMDAAKALNGGRQ